MAAKLVTAPEVEWDLSDAFAWYEEQRVGLGEDFLTSVDACIEGILQNPRIYATIYEDYRRALTRRFPYAVFYEVFDDVVTVYGVLHTARDPNKWRRRLPG